MSNEEATERRLSEKDLKEGEARLLSIIDSAMDAIITVDVSQTVVLFNKAAERIFGVTSSAAIGMPLSRFIPERFRGPHVGHVQEFSESGVTRRRMGRLESLTGLRADGREFPIEASISQAEAFGQRYLTVILRDISDKLKLEAQLLQSQKMEGIGRLAGGVAHDFNNLLMAIFNYLTLAMRRLEPGHDALPWLAQANEAAERAASLTRQLLAFARKQVISPVVLCPREVITRLAPMLHRLIGEDIVMKVVLSPDTGKILADPSHLEQVVMNLVVNSRDAMPYGGTLTIETGNIVLDEAYCQKHVGAAPGPHVMIAVSDTGVGMSDEILQHMFEPFFTTKEPGKGTGLGLATCHGIVSQSGGSIAAYSELKKGTTMRVFLPIVQDGVVRNWGTVEPTQRVVGGTETVLVAEDSEVVRNLVTESLTSAGYRVLSAEHGVRAQQLAAAHEGELHLLITDVVMPHLNGVQLAEALTLVRPGLKVIYMSGYTTETILHHGVNAERSAFMAKPFMTDELLRKVRAVLDEAKVA